MRLPKLATLATLVTIAAGIGGTVAKWSDIRAVFVPAARVELRYVEADQTGLRCFINDGEQIVTYDGQRIPIANNTCFAELRRSISSDAIERIRRAYFLIIDNKGESLEKIRIVGSDRVDLGFLGSQKLVAACIGYDGKGGLPGRDYTVHSLELFPKANASPVSIPVRSKPDSSAMASFGTGNCASSVIQGYPPEASK